MLTRTAQGLAADLAAGLSATTAFSTWIVQANDILQLVATGIAIVAGSYAVQWHRFRLQQGKKHLDKDARMKQIEDTIKETEDERKS